MSFETDIISKYKAVFGDRLYWDTMPVDWVRANMNDPFGIMQIVSGKERLYMDNSQHEFLNARVQFSIWGNLRTEVSDTARELAAEIAQSNTAEWIANPEGSASSDFNEVLKLRGSRQDFVFWYKNPHYVE